MTSLFKSVNVFQQLMFQTDSIRSVSHLWLSSRDFSALKLCFTV